MTEAEWLACEDSGRMLAFLGTKASARKLRLFATAGCRLVAHMLLPESQAGIDLAERVADGLADEHERKRGRERALQVGWHEDGLSMHQRGPAKSAVAHAMARKPQDAATNVMFQLGWMCGELPALLRDIIGNPFGPTILDATWKMPAVLSLAQAAHDERTLPSGHLDNTRLAVLSDALEDAGCTDADVLDHLRSPGHHVRGCWALDLVLGKS